MRSQTALGRRFSTVAVMSTPGGEGMRTMWCAGPRFGKLGRNADRARAAGRAGRLARLVKIADLQDRCLHPRVRADGWSPPYARGLALLIGDEAGRATAV